MTAATTETHMPRTRRAALAGSAALVASQAVARVATFAAGAAMQRFLPLAAAGVAADGEMLFALVLFLARDTIRLAVLRRRAAPNTTSKGMSPLSDEPILATLNLAIATIAIGSILTTLFAISVFLRHIPIIINDSFHVSQNTTLVFVLHHGRLLVSLVYLLAALIECLVEPFFTVCIVLSLFATRAKAESIAIAIKCIATLIGSYVASSIAYDITSNSLERDSHATILGALALALGQLIHSFVLVASFMYYVCFRPIDPDLIQAHASKDSARFGALALLVPHQIIPHKNDSKRLKNENTKPYYLDMHQLRAAFGFATQSIIKHVLTEADKLALLFIGASDEAKGAFRLVNDMGSIVVRILFAPLEEASRTFLSSALVSIPSGSDLQTVRDGAFQAIDLFAVLTKMYLILGFFSISYGWTFASQITWAFYGSSRAHSQVFIDALKTYCWYIPVMGVNGISESFVQAIGGTRTIAAQAGHLMLCSAIFALTSYTLANSTQLDGACAILLANISSMLARIAFSIAFIFRLFNFTNPELRDTIDSIDYNTSKSDKQPSDDDQKLKRRRSRSKGRNTVANDEKTNLTENDHKNEIMMDITKYSSTQFSFSNLLPSNLIFYVLLFGSVFVVNRLEQFIVWRKESFLANMVYLSFGCICACMPLATLLVLEKSFVRGVVKLLRRPA